AGGDRGSPDVSREYRRADPHQAARYAGGRTGRPGVDTAIRPGGHAGPRPREVRARPRDDLVRRRRRHEPGPAHRARPAPCRAAAPAATDPGPRAALLAARRRDAPGTAHRARPAPCRAAARDDTDPGPGDHHLGPPHRTPRKRLGEGQNGDGQKRPCLRRPLRGTGGTAPDASRPRGQRALPGPLPPAPRRRGYRPVDRVHLSRPGGRTVVPPSETLTRIGEVVEVGLESTPARKNWRKLMQDVVTHFPGHATL